MKVFELFTEFRDSGKYRSIDIIKNSHPELNGEIVKYVKKWNWIERVERYDEFHINEENTPTKKKLSSSLETLLDVIESKIISGDEIVGMKIDALIKLAAVYSKSVPDILKMKEMLEGKDEDKTNSERNFLIEKLRSNKAATDKLTEVLLEIGISN